MELRAYWQILVERRNIVVATFIVALAAALASVYLLPQGTGTYATALSLAVRPQPNPVSSTLYYSDDYYSYVASEYANDDLIAILESDDFLQAIRAKLAGGAGGAGGAPAGSIQAKKAHRIVEITISSATAQGGTEIGQAIASSLTGPDAQSKYFSLFTNRIENVAVVDGPRPIAQPAGRIALLNVAARALVGLIAGVGLAFLVEYLDDSIRPGDVERLLGWAVIADIPNRGSPPRVAKRATRVGS